MNPAPFCQYLLLLSLYCLFFPRDSPIPTSLPLSFFVASADSFLENKMSSPVGLDFFSFASGIWCDRLVNCMRIDYRIVVCCLCLCTSDIKSILLCSCHSKDISNNLHTWRAKQKKSRTNVIHTIHHQTDKEEKTLTIEANGGAMFENNK